MTRTTPFTILVVLLLAGAGAIAYIGSTPLVPSPMRDHHAIDATIARLRPLAAIRIDTSIFQQEAFTFFLLPDTPPLPTVTPGRNNPFL